MRDRLAQNYQRCTLPTDAPNVRVYIGAGLLVTRFAIFTALEDDVVEAFWLMLDGADEREEYFDE